MGTVRGGAEGEGCAGRVVGAGTAHLYDEYLKAKISAGAEVIITQLFYDANAFISWVRQCRAFGITAPILPGIMPIRSLGSFQRMTGFCKTVIPRALSEGLEAAKSDVRAVYEF